MKEEMRNGDLLANKIVLRSVNGKTSKYFILPSPDPKTGRYPKHVKQVDVNGDIRLTEEELKQEAEGEIHFIKITETFTVEDGTVFDLNDTYQKSVWEAIKNCPFIAESRDAKNPDGSLKIDGTVDRKSENPRYGVAELYVEHPGLITKNRVSRKKKLHNAIGYIIGDERGYEGRLIKAKLLGRKMDHLPDSDVEDYLIEVAEKDPDRIIALYTGDDISLRLLFVEAKEKKIITFKDKAYCYGDNVIAATDEAVITWMKQSRNKRLLDLIRLDVIGDFDEEIEETPKSNKSNKK